MSGNCILALKLFKSTPCNSTIVRLQFLKIIIKLFTDGDLLYLKGSDEVIFLHLLLFFFGYYTINTSDNWSYVNLER